MNVKVELAGKLNANLAAYRRQLAPKVERGLKAMATLLLEEAKSLVPVDTQALHDSGHATRHGSGLQTIYVVGFGRMDFDATGYTQDRERRPPYMYSVYVHQMYRPFLSIPAITRQSEMVAAFNKEVFI